MADDAGALLVRSGLVSSSALDEARAFVEEAGGTVGEHLVAGNAINDDALTEFYRQRLLVPQVNPNTLARLPARVVAAIPADMAIELRAIPVSLDGDNNLTVAMSDPSDRHAVDEIAFFTGAYVVRAVATQMQIAWCLAHYYGHVTALGHRLLQPSSAEPPAPVAAAASGRVPRTKGHTAKVDAARHRALVPITGPQDIVRPNSKGLDDPSIPPAASGRIRLASEPVPPPPPDAIVEAPRARSVSGEIKLPPRQPRAQSIKPELPPDDEPEMSIEVSEALTTEDPTGPRKIPKKRRVVKTDPPELAARAGEVDAPTGPVRLVDLDEPRIVINDDINTPTVRPEDLDGRKNTVTVEGGDDEDDDGTPVVIHSSLDRESQPILLERRARTSEPPADEPDEVVVLDARKQPRAPRPEKRTQMGIGAVHVPVKRPMRDTLAEEEPDGIPGAIDDAPTDHHTADPTSVDTTVSPAEGDASDELAPPPPPAKPRPPTAEDDKATGVMSATEPDDDDDDDDAPNGVATPATTVMSAVELDAVIPERKTTTTVLDARRQIDYDPIDEGWGPPGTTIPPPLLGAIPGADDASDGTTIPIANVDSAPLIVAPPSPPEVEAARDAPSAGHTLVKELEDATKQAVDLIRNLELARDRDEVVSLMVDHLAKTHHRAGFFVIKLKELSLFSLVPSPAAIPSATLRLDRASTLADVVGTRLPYRGPMADEPSQAFLLSVLGACPPEVLLVPVAIRDRVVGVLFGEHRRRHTFDDQLALAARAAGMALERILKTKR